MIFKTLALAALFAVGTGLTAVHAKDDHSAKHGGIFVETKALDIEIVARPDTIQIYVDDHGKAVKLDGAKARVTLLNGAEKTEVELLPAGDKLEAKGNFKVAKGTKGIASVTLAGKSPATARFEIK